MDRVPTGMALFGSVPTQQGLEPSRDPCVSMLAIVRGNPDPECCQQDLRMCPKGHCAI